eukprot:m.240791 g.240791  ORF g.240791 m.240791 type:complete len:96 (+) comp17130_c0_seq15:1465-1752(+)
MNNQTLQLSVLPCLRLWKSKIKAGNLLPLCSSGNDNTIETLPEESPKTRNSTQLTWSEKNMKKKSILTSNKGWTHNTKRSNNMTNRPGQKKKQET